MPPVLRALRAQLVQLALKGQAESPALPVLPACRVLLEQRELLDLVALRVQPEFQVCRVLLEPRELKVRLARLVLLVPRVHKANQVLLLLWVPPARLVLQEQLALKGQAVPPERQEYKALQDQLASKEPLGLLGMVVFAFIPEVHGSRAVHHCFR